MISIDETDQQILNTLRQNARISFAELGRQVSLTPPAVAGRVQRLERLGVIQGYETKVDESTLNGHLVMLIRIAVENGTERRFLKYVSECPYVRECCRTSGTENYLIKVAMPSTQALNDLLGQLMFYGQPVTSLVIADLSPAAEMA